MAILTHSGRVTIAESIKARPIHLALGTGDDAWISPPSEDDDQTALQAEVGRHTASEVAYVVDDVDGDVILASGSYTRSVTPTNKLLIITNFDFTDAPSTEIREIAVFVGTILIGGLPGGQTYFIPAELDSVGRLLHLENIEPIYRSPSIRENFQIVITF